LSVTATSKTTQTSCLISGLDNNWRTEAATDDLHHHCAIQVKVMITPSVSKKLYGNAGILHKTKNWVSFQIPRELHHSKTNAQSGFNTEQVKRINIGRVELFEE
jgi:hypothetical protein